MTYFPLSVTHNGVVRVTVQIAVVTRLSTYVRNGIFSPICHTFCSGAAFS